MGTQESMRGQPGIAIEVSDKKCTCQHADDTAHFIDIGELIMVQYHHRKGEGQKLFRTANSLCCVNPNQAQTLLSGATSGGWPVTMDTLSPVHYSVALAILGERCEGRSPKPAHKSFRLMSLKSNV